MKCLIDEALPRSLAKALKDAGFDAVDARDIGLRGKSDPEVLARAVSDGRSLITKDLDFADPRRFPPEGHFGILIVRFPDSVSKVALFRMVVDAVRTVKD